MTLLAILIVFSLSTGEIEFFDRREARGPRRPAQFRYEAAAPNAADPALEANPKYLQVVVFLERAEV